MRRTNTCGELKQADTGKDVVLKGWVHKNRNHGGVIFINLRDRYGITQLIIKSENKFFKTAESLKRDSVIDITGKVIKREHPNPDMPTGEIEVAVDTLEVLNESETLPVEYEYPEKITEDNRLKYRYLDLRRPEMQKNLLMRYQITRTVRDYLDTQGFMDIETPILAKSTPEGARDYVVPSRVHPGNFFALPQSPQQYKQLLMVAGFDRYFQIVKCFRDEDLRADRQPEFTQIDIETSFISPEEIFEILEGLMKALFKNVWNKDLKIPFPKMGYEEAMNRFGIDRPDTRFGLELTDVSEILGKCDFNIFKAAVDSGGCIKGIVVDNANFSRKDFEEFEKLVKIYGAKGLVWLKLTDDNKLEGSTAKFINEEKKEKLINVSKLKKGGTILLVADHKHYTANTALGELRLMLGKKLGLIDEKQNDFLWVVDFPLLEFDEDEQRHMAVHHPFTSPKPEHIKYLDSDPGKALADAYDLVWNGVEIAGGSKRIHQREVQQKVFSLLGISDKEAEEKFSMLLEAFKYGAPPHAGIAFGLDRLVALFTGNKSIREVIAFPKNKTCHALMEVAPSAIDEKQLEELHIKFDLQKK
jgi:aspartyl-tRNA synthetase